MKLIKFYAEWCAPCKMLGKTFDRMDISIPIENIDIDKNEKLAREFLIRGVPTVVLVDDNHKEVKRFSGYLNETQIREWLK